MEPIILNSSEEYTAWENQIEIFLMGENLHRYIQTTDEGKPAISCPDATDLAAYQAWDAARNKVLSIILFRLSLGVIQGISRDQRDNPILLMTTLSEAYGMPTEAKLAHAQRKYMQTKCLPGKAVEYLDELDSHRKTLRTLGKDISDGDHI
ncbi:hypothetical protein [Phaffia rhodozyma]|uniref:Uncharacterized protein n=1 Tax=Phaffia rhodozyma TaxID=264483 RepID=A0A0F7SH34_PHARH|nr:hypothetical protein [Phaffia rhodozyma]